MRNLIKTTTPPQEYEPYLMSKSHWWSYENTSLEPQTHIEPQGDGWYCPSFSSKCEISNQTRRIKVDGNVETVYEGYEGMFKKFFWWLGDYNYTYGHGPGEYLLIDYSATTTEDSIASVEPYPVVHCNVVTPHNFFNDIIPGVAYNSEANYVFYNPRFPLIELEPGEKTDERESMDVVGIFTYDDFGIDYEIVDEYRAAIEEGKTALEDFNIFVIHPDSIVGSVKMAVSKAEYIGDCSCWGGQWFQFGEYGTYYRVHFSSLAENEIILLRGYTPEPH